MRGKRSGEDAVHTLRTAGFRGGDQGLLYGEGGEVWGVVGEVVLGGEGGLGWVCGEGIGLCERKGCVVLCVLFLKKGKKEKNRFQLQIQGC